VISVSMVVCSRDRAGRLETALRRLVQADVQRCGVEVVLVDSASTDRTPELMRRFSEEAPFRVRVVRLERPGLSRARNAGIAAASGELLVFTDDDCYLAPDYFGCLLDGLDVERHQFGGGSILPYDLAGAPQPARLRIDRPREVPPLTLIPTGAIQGANMFFLRRVFERAGGFDERLGAGTPFPCEDIEMATRASLLGFTGVQLPAPTVYHDHGKGAGSREALQTEADYDVGRGAYYASLVARGVPRVWDLWRESRGLDRPLEPARLAGLQRELQGAADLLHELLSAAAVNRHPPALLDETRARDGRVRYCTYPFRLYGLSSSELMPCSWLRRIPGESIIAVPPGRPPDLHAAWFSQEFENVRRSVARGDYRYCQLERCPELKGAQRYFLTLSELDERYPRIARYVRGEATRYEAGPEILNIQYDSACNLACPSCSRLQSPRPEPAVLRVFADAIVQLGADLEYLYLAGMGDPFGSPHYYEWLCTVDVGCFPKLREIYLSTNALRWTEEAWRRIPERTRRFIRSVVVSLDGASPETIEANRYPAKYADQMDRLRYVASLRRAGEFQKLRVYFVYQENNFHEMPRMVELCRELGIDSVFFARLSNWNGWPAERFEALDVGHPRHPRHGELLRIAAEVERGADEGLEVVLMRPSEA